MYFNDDDNNFYDSRYNYELEDQDLPLGCPFRQMSPFPQGPSGRPPSTPPNFIPPTPHGQPGVTPFVDQGAIRPCVFRLVYIWPRRGRGFWSWLTFVGPRSVAGFRWERNNWRYFGMDLRNISSFNCF